MKKIIYSVLLAVCCPSFVVAGIRTPQELRQIADEVVLSNIQKKESKLTLDEPTSQLYANELITVYGSTDGFVVLSADDCHPAVLAYSDTPFDLLSINPGLAWWLEAVRCSLSSSAPKTSYKEGLPASVSPFIATKWNQSAPYNIFCPTYTNNKGIQHYPTGCVATAMSQVMKYYNFPEHGTGKFTYAFLPDGVNKKVVSVQLDTIPFVWDSMLDVYGSSYTEEQGVAVARLMMACGSSISMEYTESGSGAQCSAACASMRKYFGYDRGLPFHWLDVETGQEFYTSIYSYLAAKMPVVFGGVSSGGGHCFVLDGYDESGLVHVNWGWGGKNDGYFTIAGMDGYKGQQQCFPVTNAGVFPDYESRCAVYGGGIVIKKKDDTHIAFSTTAPVANISGESFKGALYVVARNASTSEDLRLATQTLEKSIYANLQYVIENNISKPNITILNKGVVDGTYHVFLASKSEEETGYSPVRTTSDYLSSVTMVVKNGIILSVEDDENVDWLLATGVEPVSVLHNGVLKKRFDLYGMPLVGKTAGIYIEDGSIRVQR